MVLLRRFALPKQLNLQAIADGKALAGIEGPPTDASTRQARQGHAYLVPPPPAYAPSILPELRRQASHPTGTNSRVIEEADASQAESTEAAKKYIYSTNGQEPKAVRQNKYVTIWNSKS